MLPGPRMGPPVLGGSDCTVCHQGLCAGHGQQAGCCGGDGSHKQAHGSEQVVLSGSLNTQIKTSRVLEAWWDSISSGVTAPHTGGAFA